MFGNVEKEVTIFSENSFEGIVGMAYPCVASKNYSGLFDNMIS
jgi:hypothetical protein